MKTSFEQTLAQRYLAGVFKDKSRRFLRIITGVGIGGVAVGVTALILALAITRGFSSTIENKILEYGGHVQVINMNDQPLENEKGLEERIQAFEGVTETEAVVQEFALLKAGREVDGVAVWGSRNVHRVVRNNLTDGSATFSSETGTTGMVLSDRLADQLAVSIGDRVTAFSIRELGTNIRSNTRVKQFTVTGLYHTGIPEFDELYAFVELEEARELLGYGPDQITRFDVLLEDPKLADEMADEMAIGLGFPMDAQSIFMIQRHLFDWVALQKGIIPLLIGIIILVAAMNIIGIQLMMVLDKVQEIGVLRAMGASTKSIRGLFVRLGLLIGVAGAAIGALLSVALTTIQKKFGIIGLPEETYYMSSAPVEPLWTDFLIVILVAIVLCILASLIPARVAAKTDPVSAIRFTA